MCTHSSTLEAFDIRLARQEDIHQLSLILALAFHHDSVYRWLFPNDSNRARKCQRLFAVFLNGLIAQGTVFITERKEGVALWVSPRQIRSGWIRQAKQGVQIFSILGLGLFRGIQWWLKIELKHPHYPHWYLFLIGVAPEHQGKGIGLALLQPMLEKCDIERLPIYVDTGNNENVSFYQRRGFEIIREVDLPDGPTVFQMVREPAERWGEK